MLPSLHWLRRMLACFRRPGLLKAMPSQSLDRPLYVAKGRHNSHDIPRGEKNWQKSNAVCKVACIVRNAWREKPARKNQMPRSNYFLSWISAGLARPVEDRRRIDDFISVRVAGILGERNLGCISLWRLMAGQSRTFAWGCIPAITREYGHAV